jgi:hypothetical protein
MTAGRKDEIREEKEMRARVQAGQPTNRGQVRSVVQINNKHFTSIILPQKFYLDVYFSRF